MPLGKMEGDTLGKKSAHMLQDDEADGPYYRQKWEGMPQATPIISGGVNALRLSVFSEILGWPTAEGSADVGTIYKAERG